MRIKGRKPVSSHGGATLVEFALCISVFLLLLVGIIDTARLIAIKTMLVKGAQEGLSLAQKEFALRTDLRELDLDNPEHQKLFAEFLQARDRVIKRAARLAAGTMVRGLDQSAVANFVPYSMKYQLADRDIAFNAAGNAEFDGSALLLRPGESAQASAVWNETAAEGWVNHTSVCAAFSPLCPQASKLTGADNFKGLLAFHPLEVRLGARVTTLIGRIFPFFSSVRLEASAMGWTEGLFNPAFSTDPQASQPPPPTAPPPTPLPPTGSRTPTRPPVPTPTPRPCDGASSDTDCVGLMGLGYCLQSSCYCVPCGGT